MLSTLSTTDKTALLDNAVFYEVLFALGVSSHDRADYCAWEHVNFSRMGHARALSYFFACGLSAKKWDDDIVCEGFGFAASQLVMSPDHCDRFQNDRFTLTS